MKSWEESSKKKQGKQDLDPGSRPWHLYQSHDMRQQIFSTKSLSTAHDRQICRIRRYCSLQDCARRNSGCFIYALASLCQSTGSATDDMATDEEATISIPSLVIVGFLLFFSYRWFFASHSSSSSSSSAPRNGLRFTAAQVEQISQMFPQLNRRDIMWDLHRNRGSVQATTERVLMGRQLDPVSVPLTSIWDCAD